MGCKRPCLVLFVLANADGLVFRLPSPLSQRGGFSSTQRDVFSSTPWFAGVVRERRTYCSSSVTYLSVEGSKDEDDRIDGNSEELLKWFSGVGGLVGPVELEETAHFGWGLKAERDVHLGEKLAVVPRSRCIGLSAPLSGASGADDEESGDDPEDNCWMGPPEVQALVEKIPRMYSDLRLGLVLLHERYKTGPSAWKPYISNLPRRLKGVPLASFGAVEMRGMQDIVLAGKIDQRCKFMVSFIKQVLDPLPPGPNAPFGEHRVSFGDLAWATAAVSSRAFTRMYGGWVQESRPLLVPLMDMLNFNFDRENVKVVAAWPSAFGDGGGEDSEGGLLVEFDEEEWEYERPEEPEVWLVATRPVAAGDSLEIKENYSNEQRLCKYGFVDVNRRKECNNMRFEKKILRAARIHAGIVDEQFGSRFEQDGLEPWQRRALEELKLDGPEQDLTVHLGGDSTNGRLPVDGRLLAALRVMFTRSKKEMEGKTAGELSRYKTGKLSEYVERRVLATVLGLVSVYGQRWPTTQEQDEEILYGRTVPPNYEEALGLPPPWQDRVLPEVTVEHLETREVARIRALEADEKESGVKDGEGEETGEAGMQDRGQREPAGIDEGTEHDGDGVLQLNPELSWEMSQAIAFRYAKKRTLFDLWLIARAELRKIGLVEGMLENAKIDIRSFTEDFENDYPVVEDDDLPIVDYS